MMDATTLKAIGDVALYVAAAAAIAMLLAYMLRSGWYRSRAGGALLSWMLASSGVLMFNAVSVYFMGDYPGRLWVRLVVYSTLAALNLRWLITIVQLQNATRRQLKAATRHHTEGESLHDQPS